MWPTHDVCVPAKESDAGHSLFRSHTVGDLQTEVSAPPNCQVCTRPIWWLPDKLHAFERESRCGTNLRTCTKRRHVLRSQSTSFSRHGRPCPACTSPPPCQIAEECSSQGCDGTCKLDGLVCICLLTPPQVQFSGSMIVLRTCIDDWAFPPIFPYNLVRALMPLALDTTESNGIRLHDCQHEPHHRASVRTARTLTMPPPIRSRPLITSNTMTTLLGILSTNMPASPRSATTRPTDPTKTANWIEPGGAPSSCPLRRSIDRASATRAKMVCILC